ncbi:MAG: hypothetical protein JHC61_02345, partial [Burkholderiaceae bacterium]|nr:hypothetical protein [Burkholderiaceae bacterium]
DKLKTSSIFLPFGVSKEISYQHRSAPGMAKANGPAADRLVEYFNGKDGKGNFVRNKYAMFGSWHVADFEERRKHTPFTLKLDNVARAIYIPSVKNDDYRRHLSYTIVGGGNTYALVTSAWNTSLTIAPSMADKEAWIIDVTASASERSEADGNGAWKHNVLKDVDISDKRMIVGGQEITFSGRPPKNLSLQLDIHGTSGLSLLLKYDWEKQSFSANLIATNNNLSISEISKLNESIARSGLKFPDIVPVSAHLLGVDYFGAVNLNDKTSLLAGVNKETNKIQFFKDGGELQILNYGGKIDSVGADSIALKDDKNNLSTFKVTKSGAHMLPLVMENAEYSHQEGDSISIFFKSGFNNEVRVPDAVISLMGKRRKLIVTNFSMSEVNPYLNTLNASSWLFPQWIEEVHIFTTGPLNLLLAGDVHSYKAISAGDDLLLVASDGLRIRIDQGYSQERIDHTNLKIRIGGKDIFAKDLADMLDRGSLSADKSIDISSKRVMEGYGELLSKASEKSGKRIYYSREKGAVAVLRHDGNELLSRSVPENLEELAWGEAIPGVKGSDIEYYYNKEKNHIVYVKNGEAPYVWQLPNYFAWNELGKLENLRIEGHSIRFNFAKGNKARNILVPWFYTEGDILTMRDSQGANFKSEIKAKAFTDDVDPMLTLERFALMHYRESVGAAHTLSTPSVSDEHSTQDLVLAGSDARKLAIGHARTAQADVEATLFVQTLNAYLDDETSVMAATESSITFSPPILASALH